MRSVDRLDDPGLEWDGFVRSQSGWTHFHLSGWKHVMESALGHECFYLAARGEGGQLTAVLPLVRVRSLLFGHYIVSMPFFNYGGPLGEPGAVRQLVDYAVELADGDSAKLLQFRSRYPLELELPVSHRKLTTLLDLGTDPDTLWESFPSKLRTKVRRPEKDGVRVQFGSAELEPFFRIFSHHMRDLGTPTHSARLFETIGEVFGDDVLVGCAYFDGRPIACGFGVCWNHEFEMTWSCALREFKTLRANMALYWAFMREAIGRGVRVFNFGRSTPGSGTHQFKLGWGARDEPLHWYYHSRSGLAAAPSPDDGAYSWGPRLWRKLPTSLATAIGPRIVRCIP